MPLDPDLDTDTPPEKAKAKDKAGERTGTLLSTMPPEMLGEIFTYSALHTPDAPLVLGAVCTAFRHVVRSTPGAWTRLHLESASPTLSLVTPSPDEDGDEAPDARWARKAQLFFAMAGACLVDVHVEIIASVSPPPHAAAQGGLRAGTNSAEPIAASFFFNADRGKALGGQQWHPDGQLLPRLLHHYRYRIRGLALHSTTVDEAERFFAALYPPQGGSDSANAPAPATAGAHPSAPANAPQLPLASLSFHASSDGVHRSLALNLAHLRHKHRPATRVSLAQCHFPRLAHLAFVNHPLPDLISTPDLNLVSSGPDLISTQDGIDISSGADDGLARAPVPVNNASSLRTLSIVYPIRFAPLAVERILQVLASAPLLEKLEIEARVLDTSSSSSSPSTPTSLPSTPLSSSTTSYFALPPYPTSAPGSAHAQAQAQAHQSDALITLPRLTYLALRINNLPALLTHLLLPALDTLRLDDLDGKRARAAAQTATVLRQLLVRMELPCPAAAAFTITPPSTPSTTASRTSSTFSTSTSTSTPSRTSTSSSINERRGLRVLDITGVALAAPPGARGAAEAAAVWAWCVRRMRALEELRAARVDTEALWALITPPAAAAPPTAQAATQAQAQESSESDRDDMTLALPLPCLRRLSIIDAGPEAVMQQQQHPAPDAFSPFLGRSPSPLLSSSSLSPSLSSSSLSPSPMLSPQHLRPTTASDAQAHHQCGPLLKFQLRRPEVHVDYRLVQSEL